jgi:phosphotriesterase-related protein
MMKQGVINLLIFLFITVLCRCTSEADKEVIMTVKGPISSEIAGIWLTHEHVLVDFIGADSASQSRYDRTTVIRRALPYLRQVKELGCRTFVDCTPEYLGRDPLILRALADSTGMNIITNTGFYGAYNNKYVPETALDKSAEQLAAGWIDEWVNGIGNTGIKPGFIKIAVNPDSLSDFHKTLARAAALTHLKTGLTIASHTGPSIPAFQQLEILKKEGVAPSAFIWVHALNEKDPENMLRAARMGAWISFDKLNDKNVDEFIRMIKIMKENNLLNKVLLSHDAGWFDPAKENGGEYRGYTTLFEKLLPSLRSEKFSEDEIALLLVKNPADAFTIKIRKVVI